jgi:transposase
MPVPANLHLEIQSHRSRHYGIIRSSFRANGKVKHTNHGRISGLPLDKLRLIQAAFRGQVVAKGSADAFEVVSSREYGASQAFLQLAKDLGLPQILYSRPEPWVAPALAMIVGRIVYAGSKLALSQQGPNTGLWELCGVEGKVDLDKHCYEVMDRLLERQGAIQRALAQKHLQNGHLVLYDITSSYLEGEYEGSQWVDFGYNRDGKRGHEQIVIALLCNEQGCPVGVEVLAGNTKDDQTVPAKVEQIQKEYGISQLIFVGDRGMITQASSRQLEGVQGLQTISALTHRQTVELLERKVISRELFDEKSIAEAIDPDHPKRRYCLCRNPQTARRETQTRKSLLEATRQQLEKTASSKRKAKAERMGARVGRVLQRFKMGKFVDWSVQEGKLRWTFNQDAIAAEERFDGCYVIVSDVPAQQMAKTEVVASYKKLSFVEQAFRNLKTVRLETRPIYHKKDERIRCHVFICLLAYYLQWHARQRLKPLFAQDGEGKHRRWTFENVIERLKGVRSERVRAEGVEIEIHTKADDQQQRIADLIAGKKS